MVFNTLLYLFEWSRWRQMTARTFKNSNTNHYKLKAHFEFFTIPFFFSGIMMNNHSPPTSTPLEPCRIVPYMNVPALRGLTLTPNAVTLSNYERLSTASLSQQGTAFSTINSAFISAAHQVGNIISIIIYTYRTD